MLEGLQNRVAPHIIGGSFGLSDNSFTTSLWLGPYLQSQNDLGEERAD